MPCVTANLYCMGLLPDTHNCGLRVRRVCRERFPHHRPQSDRSMHHGKCVMHMPWCMSGSLTRGGEENVPGIPGACTTDNSAYLVRGPCICFPILPQRSCIMPKKVAECQCFSSAKIQRYNGHEKLDWISSFGCINVHLYLHVCACQINFSA